MRDRYGDLAKLLEKGTDVSKILRFDEYYKLDDEVRFLKTI